MAVNVKVGTASAKQKLQAWANGTGIVNGVANEDLIFLPGALDENEMILYAWEREVVVKVEPFYDVFKKMIYVEKLTEA